MTFLGYALALLLGLAIPDSSQSTTDTLVTGTEASRFYASSLDGPDFFLSRKIGPQARPDEKSPIVLCFFTTTCIPCRQEIPYLDSLQVAYPQIAFYLVNVAEEPQIVKEYVRKMKYDLPILIDRYGLAAKKYLATSTPILVGINADGRIAFFKRGFRVTDKKTVRDNVEKLAGVSPLSD